MIVPHQTGSLVMQPPPSPYLTKEEYDELNPEDQEQYRQ